MKTLVKALSVVLLLAAGAYCQVATSGTITAASTDCTVGQSCIVLNNLTTGSASSGGVTASVQGTYSGTNQFEGTTDGTNWVAINGLPLNSTTGASSTTSTGVWQFNVAGLKSIRIRCSSYSSGTANITIQASTASARSGGGGSGTSVTNLTCSAGDFFSAFTAPNFTCSTPAGGGTVTVVGAGALTSTAFVTGGGTTTLQTPSATSTLSAGGNASFAGTLGASGHTTFEGVTSTGATGTGKLVYDGTPTLVTPVIGAATGTSLLVTGNLDGTVPITITTGTTANLGATFRSGYTVNQEATAGTGVTYTLPATTVGMQYCVANSGTTGVVNIGVLTVYPPASSFVILAGVVNTVGGGGTHGVVSGGAAGDSACFVAIDSTHWQVFVASGTWTEN